jgi:hypothetical protein
MESIINPFELANANDFNSPYEYTLKITSFANKTVDLLMRKIKHRIPKTNEAFKGVTTLYPKTLTEEQAEEKRLENIRRSATRAKQAVHHAVRSMGADHMLTLTTRENITDRSQFFSVFQEFIRLVRNKDLVTVKGELILKTRKEKRPYAYVAVPEFQERGAYHMHIACLGKQDLALLRACWYVALNGNENDKGELTKGAINVRYRELPFGRKSDNFSTFQLVKYMTKYMAKSFEVTNQLGLKRYSSAREIPKPIINKQFVWSSYANNGGDFRTAVTEVFAIASFMGVDVSTTWNRGEDIMILRGVEQ